MKMKGVRLTYHDDAVSTCEAIFARGDRRCGQLLMTLHEAGCKLDAWGEHFKRDAWAEALNHWEIDYRFYTERERPYDEVLPWDVIDSGVSKEFLIRESEKARRAEVTPDCRKKCSRYESQACLETLKPPYVCNECVQRRVCNKDRYFYTAKYAEAGVTRRRSESRAGIRISDEQLREMNELITRLVNKG